MTSLVIMPPKNDELNFDEILQKHLPNSEVYGTGGLLALKALCGDDEKVRDEIVARIKANHSVHAFNSAALKEIMKVDLGGIKVADLGLRTFFIYYETLVYHNRMEESPNLREFLKSIDWSKASNHAETKQKVVDYFGIKNAGALNAMTLQQTGHNLTSEIYKFAGDGWEFEIRFSLHWHKINKIPTMGAGFQGDLGRLAFFQ